MEDETTKKALAALEREKKRQKKRNEWNAAHYYRVSLVFPSDLREDIQRAAAGESVNAYINRLVREDLERREASSKQVERVQTVQPVEDVPIDWGEDGPAFE